MLPVEKVRGHILIQIKKCPNKSGTFVDIYLFDQDWIFKLANISICFAGLACFMAYDMLHVTCFLFARERIEKIDLPVVFKSA